MGCNYFQSSDRDDYFDNYGKRKQVSTKKPFPDSIWPEVQKLSKEVGKEKRQALFVMKSHRIIIDGEKKAIDTNPEALIKMLNRPFIEVLNLIDTYIEKRQVYSVFWPDSKVKLIKKIVK